MASSVHQQPVADLISDACACAAECAGHFKSTGAPYSLIMILKV